MAVPLSLQKRFVFASPWLLAAALALLTCIIIVFAASNMRREERLMREGLLHKGQALIRFAGAGARASMMRGGPFRVQQLIEQAAAEEDILYLAVIDLQGKILAHSDHAMVGMNLERELAPLRELAGGSQYQIFSPAGASGKIFEVVSPFQPFRRGRGMIHPDRRRMAGWLGVGQSEDAMPEQRGLFAPDGSGFPCPTGGGAENLSPGQLSSSGYLMLAGLDMSEQARAVKENRFHLLMISLALLLVGAGGWFSLSGAQGYRISQETLRHMRAFAGLLISKLPVGIIATGPDGRLKTWNQTAAILTGHQSIANGAKPEEVLPPSLAAFLDSVPSGKEILEQEVRIPGAEGEKMLEVSSVPIRDEESYIGRVLLLVDVTEQRRLAARLRRQDRLVALGKMAAGVAHEVRNPLSSIKGFATLLGGKFPEGSKEAETGRLLIREVERLNRTITELLNFARPLPLQPKNIDIAELLRSSLALVGTDAEALGIRIVLDLPPDLPPLQADPDRLNQVLLNLYLNGLQAMDRGGRLTVSADRRGGDRLEIAVADTGSGIPRQDLERVFDPYFTTKPGGTGLGLTMVQKIIEEQGGDVRLESEPGDGTKVTLSFPLVS